MISKVCKDHSPLTTAPGRPPNEVSSNPWGPATRGVGGESLGLHRPSWLPPFFRVCVHGSGKPLCAGLRAPAHRHVRTAVRCHSLCAPVSPARVPPAPRAQGNGPVSSRARWGSPCSPTRAPRFVRMCVQAHTNRPVCSLARALAHACACAPDHAPPARTEGNACSPNSGAGVPLRVRLGVAAGRTLAETHFGVSGSCDFITMLITPLITKEVRYNRTYKPRSGSNFHLSPTGNSNHLKGLPTRTKCFLASGVTR